MRCPPCIARWDPLMAQAIVVAYRSERTERRGSAAVLDERLRTRPLEVRPMRADRERVGRGGGADSVEDVRVVEPDVEARLPDPFRAVEVQDERTPHVVLDERTHRPGLRRRDRLHT